MSKQQLVKDFMLAFRQEVPKSPTIPDGKTRDLRFALIGEEARELFCSSKTRDCLDGIADLLYVVYGAAIAYGFSEEQINAAFEEVHRSNMSKLWTVKEVHEVRSGENTTTIGCRDADFDNVFEVTTANVPQYGKHLIVKRRVDGKVIKSPSYSPANLDNIASR